MGERMTIFFLPPYKSFFENEQEGIIHNQFQFLSEVIEKKKSG